MQRASDLTTLRPRAPGAFRATGKTVPVLMGLLALFLLAEPTLARGTLCPSRPGPVPSYGGARPGPITQILPSADLADAVAQDPVVEAPIIAEPVYPVAISIPAAGVNAGIEVLGAVDGVMQNPTGPWIVSWYPYLGSPGVPGNTVLAGHVDYAGVGPAVFAGVGGLGAGSEIVVVGADGQLLVYSVAWIAAFDVYSLSESDLAAIIGPTLEESLTLITCTGAFDAASASYSSRLVVRATRVGSFSATASAPLAAGDWSFRPGAIAEVTEDAVRFRAEPSTAAEMIDDLEAGTRLRITGRSVEGDGYVWWPVHDAAGKQGFVAAPYLTCAKGGDLPIQRGAPPDDRTGGSNDPGAAHDGTAGPQAGALTDDGTSGPGGVAPDAAGRRAPPDASDGEAT